MGHPIADKTAGILIVEPQQARRSMLVENFKKLGFPRVNSVPTLKDAFGIIEGEEQAPDWFITPLLENEPINAFHLLSMVLDNEGLRPCRVSLILEPEQTWCLPKAFAMGLYSSHGRFPDTASQMAALMDLFAKGEEQQWDDCLIAAHYLREHLTDKNQHQDRERLETRLLGLFPDRAALVIKLAEALLLGHRPEAAQRVLDKLGGLTGEIEHEGTVLAERIQAAVGAQAGGDLSGLAKALRLEHCLVVDPDVSIRNIVKEALKELGVIAVEEASDGDEAWRLMKEQTPDLVVQEWRLAKLSGDMLVQRARMNGMAATAIIVFSSLVKSKDRLLLREMGVTDVIEKPQAGPRLATSLVTILKEERRPKTIQGIERQIRSALARREHGAARRLLGELTAKSGKEAELARATLEAEIAFQEGNLQKASDLATNALLLAGEDVVVLNLLGKIYMKLGRFGPATKYFDQAQKLSPQNVGRLVCLAEAAAGADQGTAAEEALEKAKALDPGNEQVVEADAKVALAKNDAPRAKAIMEQMGSTPSIVAFVNNRAVALVNQDRVRESVDLYRTALKSLPAAAEAIRPVINYNLAMALIRLGDTRAAHKILQETKSTDATLTAKVQSLAHRAGKAVKTGEKMVLNIEPATVSPEIEAQVAAALGGAGPQAPISTGKTAGTARLHGIFDDDGADPRVQKLLPTGAGYKARKALQKGGHGDKRGKKAV